MKLSTRIAVWVVLVWCVSIGVAHAQSVRVIADGASIWTPTDIPILITTVKAGTVLEVRGRRNDIWLLVIVPHDPNYRGRIGMILGTQVEAVVGTAPLPPVTPPNTRETARRPPPARPRTDTQASQPQQPRAQVARSPEPPRASIRPFVFGTAGYHLTALHFDNSEQFPVLLEQATRDTAYQVKTGPGFEAGGGAGVARHVLVMASASWRMRSDPASLNEQVPNPISYNQPRSLVAESAARRQEAAGHLGFAYVLGSPSGLQVSAGGGPSVFYVRQAVISDVAYKETYPYDSIVLQSLDSKTLSKVGFGLNGQVDVVVPIARRLGWQTTGRYSRGFLKLRTGDNDFDVPVGGSQVQTGFRVYF